MNAADVMTGPVVSVEPGATARTATALLVDHGFSALPVCDDEGRLVGTASGSDLLLAGLGRATGDLQVRQVMRAPVISAPLTASATDLVGAVSRIDLLRAHPGRRRARGAHRPGAARLRPRRALAGRRRGGQGGGPGRARRRGGTTRRDGPGAHCAGDHNRRRHHRDPR
nr:CBS domain-containing protein [Actinosynnema pretiosum]